MVATRDKALLSVGGPDPSPESAAIMSQNSATWRTMTATTSCGRLPTMHIYSDVVWLTPAGIGGGEMAQHMWGPEALAHVGRAIGARDPDDDPLWFDPMTETAWWRLIEAAADEQIVVEQLDTDYEPRRWPVGYAIRQQLQRDLWPSTDLSRLRLRRDEIEQLWPLPIKKPNQAAVEPMTLPTSTLPLAEQPERRSASEAAVKKL
jgi:hypothetical protein